MEKGNEWRILNKQLEEIKKQITDYPRWPELQGLRDLAKAQTAVENKLKILNKPIN